MNKLNAMVISEIDQMLTGIKRGSQKDLQDARDWLADTVLDGNPEAICILLRGWLQQEEEKSNA